MQNVSANYEILFLSVQERSTLFLASTVSASRFGETSCGRRKQEVCFILHHVMLLCTAVISTCPFLSSSWAQDGLPGDALLSGSFVWPAFSV